MEISVLVWRLFILLLPGITTTLLVRYATTNKNYAPFYFIIYSAIFGIVCFLCLELLISAKNIICAIGSERTIDWGFNLIIWDSFLQVKDDANAHLPWNEIIFAMVVSVPLGVLFGRAINRKHLIRLLQKWKITKRVGDDDIWSYFLNLEDKDGNSAAEWIIVRDESKGLAYYGYLRSYSTTNERRELVLEQVAVYNSMDWQELYEMDAVLLELEDKKFTIEIPNTNINVEETNT